MKKKTPTTSKPEYTPILRDEPNLDLNELMDVQGGIDDNELPNVAWDAIQADPIPTKHKMRMPGNE